MSQDQTTDDSPDDALAQDVRSPRQSMELPAVIIGDRGDESTQPRRRVLPGRVPKYWVLYPAYAAVGLAGLLGTHFSMQSQEWQPAMVLFGWGLLFCWYWVYGVAYRYRRQVMKYFSLFMSAITAISLVMVSAVRSTSMAVPDNGELVVRGPQSILIVVAALTTLSLAAIITHVLYLGRGYRQKELNGDNENEHNTPPN